MNDVKKDFIIPILVLTVICLVTSAALAATQQVTAPIIAEAEARAAEAARLEVLPGASGFTRLSLEGLPEGVQEVYEADGGAGVVVIATGSGYGGEMKVIVGLDADGNIVKTKTLSHAETAGLGSKTAEAPFQAQFEGKDAALEGVSTIGGSTISSKCFIGIVEKAFSAYTVARGGSVENPVGLTGPRLQSFYPGVAEFRSVQAADGTRGIHCDNGAGTVVYAEAQGYGGPIRVAVLFDSADVILGVVVDEHSETEGIGSQVAEEGFTAQFAGKQAAEGIDNVAGATMSSEAVKKAVGEAVAKLPAVKGA